MNRAHIETNWLEYHAGSLAATDEAALVRELAEDRLQRDLLLRDGEMDRILDALPFNDRTAADFTAEVLAKWRLESKHGRPSPARNGHARHHDEWSPPFADDAASPRRTGGSNSWWKYALAASILVAMALAGWLALSSLAEPRDLARPSDKPRQEEPQPPDDAPPLHLPDGPVPPIVRDRPQAPRRPGRGPDLVKDLPVVPRKDQDGKAEPRHRANSIARLTHAEACHWKGVIPEEWLGTDRLELLSGTATVTFHDGAVVELRGPTLFELNSTKEGVLRRGKAQAKVPANAAGFRMQTPPGTVVDAGATYALDIEADGATAIKVERGQVVFTETGTDGQPGNTTQVKQGETKRFAVKPLPRNPGQRRFRGQININGKLVEFDNPEEFRKAHEKMVREMQERMRKQMEEMQERMRKQFELMPRGPGQRPPGLGPLGFLPGPDGQGDIPVGPSGFRERLFIDGKFVEFTDPWEYQRTVRREMMKQLQRGK